MSINLGYVPQSLTVTLVRGSGFASRLTSSAGWPAGTVIALVFGDITWPALISGSDATWDYGASDVAAVLDAGVRTALLTYTDTSGEKLPWARGPINGL